MALNQMRRLFVHDWMAVACLLWDQNQDNVGLNGSEGSDFKTFAVRILVFRRTATEAVYGYIHGSQ
jgi:hypothetical protein